MNNMELEPTVGEKYQDCINRTLVVTAVQPGDPLGREVIGKLESDQLDPASTFDYSCPMSTWVAIWRDKAPTWKGKQ